MFFYVINWFCLVFLCVFLKKSKTQKSHFNTSQKMSLWHPSKIVILTTAGRKNPGGKITNQIVMLNLFQHLINISASFYEIPKRVRDDFWGCFRMIFGVVLGWQLSQKNKDSPQVADCPFSWMRFLCSDITFRRTLMLRPHPQNPCTLLYLPPFR